jgi:hypothetical protein
MPTFRELADALPLVGSQTPLREPPPDGISKPEARPSGFIEPTLTSQSGDLATAKVVLIAAPAAVGKSTFAEAIAADRGALLWNLGDFPVGSGTFLGKLTSSHGISALATVTSELSGGGYCLVLDALDEGYSLSRSDNFEAFVSDLATQIRELSPAGIGIVACGRTDTVDLTALLLADARLDTCVMTLDFFSSEAAREFVDSQLDKPDHADRPHMAHRQHRDPFEKAREALFERVQTAVGVDDGTGGIDASSFLGYAPVLVALAGYLRVRDYQALVNDLRDAGSSSSGPQSLWTFLSRIVVDLLVREQPKLVERLPAHVRSGVPAGQLDELYSPEEQCARLLARAASTAPPTVDLPTGILPEYEKSVAGTLGEHPFVGGGPEGFASVVFRDYVLGRALATNDAPDAARQLARRRAFKPSPLLVRFYIECAGTSDVDPQDLDVLYASAHAEEVGAARASLAVEQTEAGLDIEIITARGDLLEFNVAGAGEAHLGVGSHLSRSDIYTPDWTIVIGRGGTEAIVGPAVSIECDRLIVSSASIRIDARSGDDAVVWRARCVEHDPNEFDLSGASRERLRITSSEPPAYPWSGFVSPDEGRGGEDQAVEEGVRQLKRLATRFKPAPVSSNDPALPTRIVDVLVARRRVSPEMYEYALQKGLITVVGKVCLLHPQQFGMNIVDLKERRITPAIREFLADYIGTKAS